MPITITRMISSSEDTAVKVKRNPIQTKKLAFTKTQLELLLK